MLRARWAAWCGAVVLALLTVVPGTEGVFIASVKNPNNSVGTAPYFSCMGVYEVNKPTAAYTFSEITSTRFFMDHSAARDNATIYGRRSLVPVSPLACPRWLGMAWGLDGRTDFAAGGILRFPPDRGATQEIWFKTAQKGGLLMSFSSSNSTNSATIDRALYLDNEGRVAFTAMIGSLQTIVSPLSYSDDKWHHVAVAFSANTLSPPNVSLEIYVDGFQVATTNYRGALRTTQGYWRFGGDNLRVIVPIQLRTHFAGQLRFGAIYPTLLTPQEIRGHYAVGKPNP